MKLLAGYPKGYAWGSPTRIPEFLGEAGDGRPQAELWFGAHSLGSARLQDTDLSLEQAIGRDPTSLLGHPTMFTFGEHLPFLVKLIAPAAPLSLQVHPGKAQAQAGFLGENARGVAPDSYRRVYKDPNHKPELVFALSEFEALIGFAVRTQIRHRLEGLDCALASRLSRRLTLAAGRGLKPVVSWILDPDDGPVPQDLAQFRNACAKRVETGASPCEALDRTIVNLYDAYPGDPGVLFAFTMNHLHLQPGEAVFIPPGTVHSYQQGFALEVLANSDNVIRAGFTSKFQAAAELLEVAHFEPHPPMRLAPEHPGAGVDRFWAPVEDFVLTVYQLPASQQEARPVALPTSGPRIALCLEGQASLQTRSQQLELHKGQAAFIADCEGQAVAFSSGGRLALCSVP